MSIRTAYFDCFSGISGDMMIGSLLDSGLDFMALKSEIYKLGLPGVKISATKVTRCSIAATKFDVEDRELTTFRHLPDLNKIVDSTPFSASIKVSAKAIFGKLAAAEARCHGVPIDAVHFHEIGAADTIVDVVGTLIALERLHIKRVVASRLNVGSGTVTFSHGTYPVPAPATAELLREVPVYSTETTGELVTPTGAAIITTLAEQFGEMPPLTAETIGYGAGTRELARPNVLRVFVGETVEERTTDCDTVSVLETNIDDMNPQIYDHVLELLLDAGALDAYLIPIIMKKGRPAIKLCVLCKEDRLAVMARIIFTNTTSIGIRHRSERRDILPRKMVSLETVVGPVEVKVATLDGKVINARPEYEQCLSHARRLGIPLEIVLREVEGAVAKMFTDRSRPEYLARLDLPI